MAAGLTDLNLSPSFAQAIAKRVKKSTLKLGDRREDYGIGDELTLTTGWNPHESAKQARIRITEVRNTRINRLDQNDLKDEGFECLRVADVPLILSFVYQRDVQPHTWVTLIRWEYI